MKTKTIKMEFEQAKVVNVTIDLGNLESYKSRFLALKNHQRETDEILDARGFYGSNKVRVVLLIDESEPEAEELEKCKDWAGQFGVIKSCEVDTAWILDEKNYGDGVTSQLHYDDWYVYGKRC